MNLIDDIIMSIPEAAQMDIRGETREVGQKSNWKGFDNEVINEDFMRYSFETVLELQHELNQMWKVDSLISESFKKQIILSSMDAWKRSEGNKEQHTSKAIQKAIKVQQYIYNF